LKHPTNGAWTYSTTPDCVAVCQWCEGNYGAYIEDLKKRKGPDADQPHRIKHKKLVR
jgi:hypothetical protein